MSVPTLRLGDAIVCLLAFLEREYGQARLLKGPERRRVAEVLPHRGPLSLLMVIDLGDGSYATCNGRGGDIRIYLGAVS